MFQANHKFSFDCHDPGVHSAPTVRGLLDHYRDPHCCMFFEPLLVYGVPRKTCFSLQVNYDDITYLVSSPEILDLRIVSKVFQ